jgi:hypothetical protein
MKPNRDAAALAASLSSAAAAPLPLPEKIHIAANSSVAPVEQPAPPPKKSGKVKTVPDTVGITLRPERDLLNRYTIAAADRTRKEGKVISAQQIMIEVLERGLQVKL